MHKIALDRPLLSFQRTEGMNGVASNIVFRVGLQVV